MGDYMNGKAAKVLAWFTTVLTAAAAVLLFAGGITA
jgi:Mn2+/Fe2+ NRAMP family transporter